MGKSLHDYNSKGPNTVAGSPRAVKVSFDRPYPGDGASHLFIDDAPIIYWTESRGYDVKYATNIDLHGRPELADRPTRTAFRRA